MQFENEKFEFLNVVALEQETAKVLDYLPTPAPDVFTITDKWNMYRRGIQRDVRLAFKEFIDIDDSTAAVLCVILMLMICVLFFMALSGPANFQ